MKSFTVIVAVLTFLAHSQALHSQDVFLLTTFDHSPDTATVEWLEQQTAQIFSEAGLTFSWQPRKQLNHIPTSAQPIWVQFHGACRIEPTLLSSPQNGPMGWVQSQDGDILPLIDIDCDRTSAMVWQNRGTLPRPLVIRAFGRALGRVVSHELYHYLTKSAEHSDSDVLRHAMTSRDLTLPEVRLAPSEIEALRKAMNAMQTSERSVTE
jgi:hypothetical protein